MKSAISNLTSNTLSVFSSWWSSALRALTSFALATGSRSPFAFANSCLVDRIRSRAASHRRLGIQNLTAVDPNLDPDLAERRARLGKTIIDIGAQSVEWELSPKVATA